MPGATDKAIAGRSLKRWTGRILLLTASLLVSLMLMEGIARVFHQRTFDPHWTYKGRKHELDDRLIYRHVPNAEGVQDCSPATKRPNRMCRETLAAGQTYREEYVFDADGIRSNENELPPPSGDHLVIVATGDSYTYGAMLKGSETWAARLEVALADAGHPARVLNAGVNGYGMDQKYRYVLERAGQHSPDLALIGLHANDVSNDISTPLYGLEGDQLIELDARLSWRHVQGRLYLSAPDWLRQSHSYDLLLSSLTDRDFHGVRPDNEDEQVAFANRKALLEIVDLDRSASQLGFRTLTIRVPAPYGESRYPDLGERLRDHGALYLDLDRSFREELEEAEYQALFFAEGHPNQRGHEAIAQAILRYLLDRPQLLQSRLE